MIATALVAAHSANAAIYQIVPVDSNVSATKVYSSAINDSSTASESDPLGCFADSASCSASSYKLGGDTREGDEGFSYRDEVPFKFDNTFTYLDYTDLSSYCYNQLGYSTCDSWAQKKWFGDYSDNSTDSCDYSLTGGLCQERQAYENGYNGRNAIGIIDGAEISTPVETSVTPTGGTLIADSANTVVNKVFANGMVIGITSSGYYDVAQNNTTNYVLTYRQRGFYDTTFMLPKQDGETIVKRMGRTFAYDSFVYSNTTYVVGSASVSPFAYSKSDKAYYGDLKKCINTDEPELLVDCQNFAFATKAYVWPATDGTSGVSVSGWDTTSANNDTNNYAAAQGSVRAAAVPTTTTYANKPVLAGFNTTKKDKNYLMQAAIFYPKSTFTSPDDADQWETAYVSGAEVEQGDDYIYSNSLIKDINDNLIAIGEAKRSGSYPENGAANNRLFYTDASTGSADSAPTAVYLSGDIFFSGAGGEANAINNYNEVVGAIDAEDSREVNGKQRRRRGFIDPLSLSTSNADRLALFENKSWWLDNLTNGGDYSEANNQYRIVSATGINDDGVISATANFCDGGYDDTSHNAYCGNGTQDEQLVAVKLIPIAGATSADIETRGEDKADVERQGGSLGYLALTMLGLISFRRRKTKM